MRYPTFATARSAPRAELSKLLPVSQGWPACFHLFLKIAPRHIQADRVSRTHYRERLDSRCRGHRLSMLPQVPLRGGIPGVAQHIYAAPFRSAGHIAAATDGFWKERSHTRIGAHLFAVLRIIESYTINPSDRKLAVSGDRYKWIRNFRNGVLVNLWLLRRLASFTNVSSAQQWGISILARLANARKSPG